MAEPAAQLAGGLLDNLYQTPAVRQLGELGMERVRMGLELGRKYECQVVTDRCEDYLCTHLQLDTSFE